MTATTDTRVEPNRAQVARTRNGSSKFTKRKVIGYLVMKKIVNIEV